MKVHIVIWNGRVKGIYSTKKSARARASRLFKYSKSAGDLRIHTVTVNANRGI